MVQKLPFSLLRSGAILLSAFFFVQCDPNEKDELEIIDKQISDLSKKIDEGRLSEGDYDIVENGLKSKSRYTATTFIDFASNNLDNKRIRLTLLNTIEERILTSDQLIASALARVLPNVAKLEWKSKNSILIEALKTGNSDIAWCSLKAMSNLGSEANLFTPEIERYLLLVKDELNLSGVYSSIETLLAIGSPESLSLVLSIDIQDSIIRRMQIKAQEKFEKL